MTNSKIKNQFLTIATPTNNGMVHTEYLQSLMGTHYLLKANVYTENCKIGNLIAEGISNIVKGRDDLLNQWYYEIPESNYFMWIDSDMGWNAEDVFKLWKYRLPLVAGAGSRKFINWNDVKKVVNDRSTNNPNEIMPIASRYCSHTLTKSTPFSNVYRTNYIGTAFMMLTRELINKMFKFYGKDKDLQFDFKNKHKGLALHKPLIVNGQYLGEDYSFCERVRKINEKVLIDTSVKLKHIGRYVWEGDCDLHLKKHPKYKNSEQINLDNFNI